MLAAFAAITQSIYGTACLVYADGTSVSHNGAACLPGPQLLRVDDYYAVASCDQRVLIRSPVPGTRHNASVVVVGSAIERARALTVPGWLAGR